MKAKVIGYTILSAVYALTIPFASEYGIWLPVVAALVGTLLATSFGRIGLAGITVVFFVLSFLIPVAFLYWIGLQAQMDAPLRQVFRQYDWMRALLPWFFAIVASYAAMQLKQRRHEKGSVTQ